MVIQQKTNAELCQWTFHFFQRICWMFHLLLLSYADLAETLTRIRTWNALMCYSISYQNSTRCVEWTKIVLTINWDEIEYARADANLFLYDYVLLYASQRLFRFSATFWPLWKFTYWLSLLLGPNEKKIDAFYRLNIYAYRRKGRHFVNTPGYIRCYYSNLHIKTISILKRESSCSTNIFKTVWD